MERAKEEAARHLAAEDMPDQPLAAADLLAAFESSIASAAASVQDVAARGQEDLGWLRDTIGRRELALADHAALTELEKLSVEHRQAADGQAALTETLAAHRSAELLASPIRHRDQASLAMERSAKEFLDRIDAAETHPLYPAFVSSRPDPDHAGQALLDEAADRLAAELGRMRALLPEEQRLQTARSDVQRFERRAAQLAQDLAAAAADREQLLATRPPTAGSTGRPGRDPGRRPAQRALEQAQLVREAVADHAACRAKTEAARAAATQRTPGNSSARKPGCPCWNSVWIRPQPSWLPPLPRENPARCAAGPSIRNQQWRPPASWSPGSRKPRRGMNTRPRKPGTPRPARPAATWNRSFPPWPPAAGRPMPPRPPRPWPLRKQAWTTP